MVAIPTVHLNGTSYDELMRQVLDARDAIHKAEKALTDMAPNGRDYYPQGDDALRLAQAKHKERMNALRTIVYDLEEMTSGIFDQKRD